LWRRTIESKTEAGRDGVAKKSYQRDQKDKIINAKESKYTVKKK
jgi:hypothetical protein